MVHTHTASHGADARARLAALGGVLGPAAFVGAWAVLGARRDGYSPVDDAISRLAEIGASTRPGMTAGFVVFGTAVPLFAVGALRPALPGRAWMAAAATGVATLGVAAFPLGAADTAHGVCAGIGYATLAATPLLAAGPLRDAGLRRAAAASLLAGGVSAVALLATTFAPAHGFWQRAGLTASDAWLVAAGVALARGWVADRLS